MAITPAFHMKLQNQMDDDGFIALDSFARTVKAWSSLLATVARQEADEPPVIKWAITNVSMGSLDVETTPRSGSLDSELDLDFITRDR